MFIGCGSKAIETVKVLVLMGYCSGPEGSLTLVSSSQIKANDFLSHGIYEPSDLNKMKAEVLKNHLLKKNPSLKIKTITEKEAFQNPAEYPSLWSSPTPSLLICTVDEHHLTLSILSHSITLSQPLITLSSPRLTVSAHSVLPSLKAVDSDSYRARLQAKITEEGINLNSKVLHYPTGAGHCILWAKSIFSMFFTNFYYQLLDFSKDKDRFMQELEEKELEFEYELHILALIKFIYLPLDKKNFSKCVDLSIEVFTVGMV